MASVCFTDVIDSSSAERYPPSTSQSTTPSPTRRSSDRMLPSSTTIPQRPRQCWKSRTEAPAGRLTATLAISRRVRRRILLGYQVSDNQPPSWPHTPTTADIDIAPPTHPNPPPQARRSPRQSSSRQQSPPTLAAGPRGRDNYRMGILEAGGSRDELAMLAEFLGRPPSPEALVRTL